MVEVNWTEEALEDLHKIGDYIETESSKFAILTIETLFYSTEILESSPQAGRVVPEFQKNWLRELIRGNYRIVYRIVGKKRIDILTVHHSKRLLSNNPFLQDL
ncbi:MAG: hypothetical protein HW421_977 [Ignavibacteria bacterium]|nr:hypothetical protein [Ignavibacteria bacterium]